LVELFPFHVLRRPALGLTGVPPVHRTAALPGAMVAGDRSPCRCRMGGRSQAVLSTSARTGLSYARTSGPRWLSARLGAQQDGSGFMGLAPVQSRGAATTSFPRSSLRSVLLDSVMAVVWLALGTSAGAAGTGQRCRVNSVERAGGGTAWPPGGVRGNGQVA